MLEQLLQCAWECRKQGSPAQLAVIAGAQGSTPRTTGAAMVVRDGRVLAGTVGGGELEYRCAQMAGQTPAPLVEFCLDNRQAAELGMVCGGSAQVLFVPLADGQLLEECMQVLKRGEPGWLLLPLDGGKPWLVRTGELSLYPERREWEGKQVLSLPLAEPGRVWLLGGGHVSLALSRILDVLGYPYIVVDDRPEFAAEERFPRAMQCIETEFAQLAGAVPPRLAPGSRDCLCIMTRGHLADTDALRYALGTEAGYIGLMGSRKKRERVLEMLTREGFAQARDRIVTPIGLPIGGQTPEEIAVSVAAQVIQFRCGKGSVSQKGI